MKHVKLFLIAIAFSIHISVSFAQEAISDLKEMATTAYKLNEYEEALKIFLQLKQNGVESIDGESIDQKIDLCEEILTLTSYAEARVLYRQRKFDEVIALLNKCFIKPLPDIDILKRLCKDAQFELNNQKPRIIGTSKDVDEELNEFFTSPLFTESYPFVSCTILNGESLAPYYNHEKGKWGYMNIYSGEKQPAEYNVVTSFREGLALVRKGKKWHYINTDNKIVITNIGQIKYRDPFKVDDGFYYDNDGEFKQWDYSFRKGGIFSSFINMDLAQFSDGAAILDEKRLCIDREGTVLFDFSGEEYNYRPISPFVSGYAVVQANDCTKFRLGVIDKKGKIIIPCEYHGFTNLGCGLIGFQKTNDKREYYGPKGGWGYLNLNNEIVIPQKYENARTFSEDLAAVQLNGKWGYIDTGGNTIIPFIFDKAYDFGHLKDGFAHVRVGDNEGFVDHFGFSTLDDILYESDNELSEQKRINDEIHNICPFIITDIQFSYDINGKLEINDRIIRDNVTYIFPIISYHGIINTECDLDVKWYTPDYNLKTGRGSTSGFSYSSTNIIERGDHKMTLSGWGNNNPGTWSQKGEYVMELWYKGRLVKSKKMTIY